VICANQIPDHATIARFRVRHESALGDLFGQVLGLCAEAGLVEVGVVAVDGTKLAAAASNHSNRSYEQIAESSETRPRLSPPARWFLGQHAPESGFSIELRAMVARWSS
jgi:hypothetical protein